MATHSRFQWFPLPWAGALLTAVLLLGQAIPARSQLLNASFDISRELFNQLNPEFIRSWQARQGSSKPIRIQQSHGGSTKQARAVIDGLNADVVTLNQATDVDALAAKGLVSENWRQEFPHASAPFASTIVFLVRRGNPKGIRDWGDLVKPGVSAVIPNPKTSGNGRYSYLAAYAYALKKLGRDEAGARRFVADLFRNVPVLDTGGRGATTTFAQRSVGDVLLTFEAEAFLTLKELPDAPLEMIRPSYSVEADLPVAVVHPVTRRKGTEAVAKAYLDFLFTEAAQEIGATNHFRPRLPGVLQRHATQFGGMELFRVEEALGPWPTVHKDHFAEGGFFDQIARDLRHR